MWVQVERVTEANIRDYVPQPTELLLRFVRESIPTLGYRLGDDVIGVVGFVPMALVTDTAYLWMESFPGTFKHKLAVGRMGILTLSEIRKRYSRVVGHCTAGSRSVEWLRSLGATFSPGPNNTVKFEIGAV